MITFESVVTLVATLVTAFIAMLLIHGNALRREKLKHSAELLELARKLPCDEANYLQLKNKFAAYYEERAHPSINGAEFLEQALFGVVVFIGFAWWGVHLLDQNELWWTLVAAIFALIGLLFILIAWLEIKQRNTCVTRLTADMDNFVVTAAAPITARTAPERRPAAQETPQVTAVSQAQTTPAAAPQAVASLQPKPAIGTKTPERPASAYRPRVPEDSILRRHFLTTLRNEIAVGRQPYPTDSILRRHYEHWLQTQLQQRIVELQA